MRIESFLCVVLFACGDAPPLDPSAKESTVTSVDPPGTKTTSLGQLDTPITGGTLLLDGPNLIASNPAADRLDVVDAKSGDSIWEIELPSGSEPGRLISAGGRVHVALRRGGAIATLDIAARAVEIRQACANPRGLAADDSAIYVACARGELAVLRNDGTRSILSIPNDARDIVLADGMIYVTRFRAASFVTLDLDGKVIQETAPPAFTVKQETFQPHVAWRARLAPDGSVWVLHQFETTRALPTKPINSSLPYGPNGADCDGRPVEAAITRFVGGKPAGTMLVPFASPSVDFAIDAMSTAILSSGGGYGPSALIASLKFDPDTPACARAGTKHGAPWVLDPRSLSDLAVYLESL